MYQPEKRCFREHEARVWDGEEQWEIKSGEKGHEIQLQHHQLWVVYNDGRITHFPMGMKCYPKTPVADKLNISIKQLAQLKLNPMHYTTRLPGLP